MVKSNYGFSCKYRAQKEVSLEMPKKILWAAAPNFPILTRLYLQIRQWQREKYWYFFSQLPTLLRLDYRKNCSESLLKISLNKPINKDNSTLYLFGSSNRNNTAAIPPQHIIQNPAKIINQYFHFGEIFFVALFGGFRWSYKQPPSKQERIGHWISPKIQLEKTLYCHAALREMAGK